MYTGFKSVLKCCGALGMSLSLAVSSSATAFAATSRELTQDEMTAIFDDAIIIAEAWKSIGFTSEQIKDILSLDRNESIDNSSAAMAYAAGAETETDEKLPTALCEETDKTRQFEKQLKSSIHHVSGARSANGNPPTDNGEQAERIKHVYQDFYQTYAGQQVLPKYIAYLYLSHYVDNPDYDRESPNFDAIYADILTSEDIQAYDNYIDGTNFRGLSDDIVHFANAVYDLTSISADVLNAGKIISVNTAANVLLDFESAFEDVTTINDAIVNGMRKKYSTAASVDQIIRTVTDSIEDPINELTKDYIALCVTGLISVLTSTPVLAGLSISLSVFYYDCYSSLINRARLAALQYSYHGRLALRIEKTLYS